MSAQDEVLPPIQHMPTAKEKKYDRQLRLWAAAGQAALEEAHLLLINAGPGVTGIETLKNLVLPGIGNFTILDSEIVTEADLGVNFFLDVDSLGKSRAEQTCKFLLELNPDVTGHYISEPVTSWINDHTLSPYTLIIVASPVHPDVLTRLVTFAQAKGIAIFHVHCVGFYSHFSVLLPPVFPIVDAHPEPSSTTDLRLLRPWPELAAFAKSKTLDLKQLSGFDLAHVPYVALLLYYLEEWRQSHDGENPLSYKDKTAFRDHVRASGPVEEENYAEAASAVLKTINEPTVASSVLKVLNAPEAINLTADSSSFCYIAAAIRLFYERHGQIPLPGALPDMKAQSSDYVTLQNIYKTKARQDCAEVAASVTALVTQHGRKQAIDQAEIDLFCKLAAHVRLVRGSATPFGLVVDPLQWTTEAGKSLVAALPNPDFGIESPVLVYIAFVAFDAFLASHADQSLDKLRAPGSSDVELDKDAEKLAGIAHKVLDAAIDAAGTRVENPQYDLLREQLTQICSELTRAGGGELHNIASLTGGMVAQEVIKVVTRQYVPIDNVCVFDGVASRTGVYRI